MGKKWTQDEYDQIAKIREKFKRQGIEESIPNVAQEFQKTSDRAIGGIIDKVRKSGVMPKEKYTQAKSLCWYCKHATNKYGACSWSARFKPVDGWESNLTKYLYRDRVVDTYNVKKCPKFEEG